MLFRSFFNSFKSSKKKKQNTSFKTKKTYLGRFCDIEFSKIANRFVLIIENKTDNDLYINWEKTEFKESYCKDFLITSNHYRINYCVKEVLPSKVELRKEFFSDALLHIDQTKLSTNFKAKQHLGTLLYLRIVINNELITEEFSLEDKICF